MDPAKSVESPTTRPATGTIRSRVDSHASGQLCLAAEDVSFLLEVIPRLPTKTDQQGRITLDLKGQVAMLAKGHGSSPVTQVVLRNSHRSGDEMRLNYGLAVLGLLRATRLS